MAAWGGAEVVVVHSWLLNDNRFTNFDTGGRLIDLQWVYSLSTLALGIAAFYLWTRYWLLFQSNEAGLLTAIKYYLLAYVVTWLLGVRTWTQCRPTMSGEHQHDSYGGVLNAGAAAVDGGDAAGELPGCVGHGGVGVDGPARLPRDRPHLPLRIPHTRACISM